MNSKITLRVQLGWKDQSTEFRVQDSLSLHHITVAGCYQRRQAWHVPATSSTQATSDRRQLVAPHGHTTLAHATKLHDPAQHLSRQLD